MTRSASNAQPVPQDTTPRGPSSTVAGLEHEDTTLILFNIPLSAAYADVVAMLKGGRIEFVNLRSRKDGKSQIAIVAFVNGANDFLRLVKRHQVFIDGKLVSLPETLMHRTDLSWIDGKWADNQSYQPAHIKRQIANGATRNLVIENAPLSLTPQQVAVDMHHIDGLVVVDCRRVGINVYLSTNSIRYAISARQCMLTRAVYNKCHIKYDMDECDVPVIMQAYVRGRPKPAAEECAGPANRFEALSLCDEGAES